MDEVAPRIITTPLTVLLRNRRVLIEKVNRANVCILKESDTDPREFYVSSVTYSRPFDNKWSDQEILDAITSLDCLGSRCFKLASLPDLPNCRSLYCQNNALTSLPRLDICEIIYCYNNNIQEIRPLPLCTMLSCHANPLRSILPLPTIEWIGWIGYDDNLDVNYWRKHWSHLRKKYFRLWYLSMLKRKAIKRRDLHDELRFSPDVHLENEYALAKKSFNVHLNESKQK